MAKARDPQSGSLVDSSLRGDVGCVLGREQMHMSQHGALDDDMPETREEQGAPSTQAALQRRRTALEAAAAGWVRRGYVVRYQDALLIQLIRRERPGWRAFGWLALALGTGIAAALLALGAFRGRRWHVVTLAQRPDGRVIMHSQRAPHPPSPGQKTARRKPICLIPGDLARLSLDFNHKCPPRHLLSPMV